MFPKQLFGYQTNFLLRTECISKCRLDCTFKYYDWQAQIMDLSFKDEWCKWATVMIKHNGSPDILVKHMPEIQFISFISNFGGLLGMWLGISVVMIFENSLKVFQKYLFLNKNKNKVVIKSSNVFVVKPKPKPIVSINSML